MENIFTFIYRVSLAMIPILGVGFLLALAYVLYQNINQLDFLLDLQSGMCK